MPLLIAILSRGFVRVMLLSLASFSFSICFSRRVEVLLFFLGNGVSAFSGLSCLLGALYLPRELLQLSPNLLWLVRQSASISLVLACRVSSVPPRGRLSTLPCWSCILGGLIGSCLCSKLIPSVTKRSALFVKELSFPQTAPN